MVVKPLLYCDSLSIPLPIKVTAIPPALLGLMAGFRLLSKGAPVTTAVFSASAAPATTLSPVLGTGVRLVAGNFTFYGCTSLTALHQQGV
jgi:hypothetical protein